VISTLSVQTAAVSVSKDTKEGAWPKMEYLDV